eukprot:2607317-Prymnesium_polylepis.3
MRAVQMQRAQARSCVAHCTALQLTTRGAPGIGRVDKPHLFPPTRPLAGEDQQRCAWMRLNRRTFSEISGPRVAHVDEHAQRALHPRGRDRSRGVW